MQIPYIIVALNNAPSVVQLIIDALKVRKANHNPQYGEDVRKACRSHCPTAPNPLGQLASAASASEHEVQRIPTARKITGFILKSFKNATAQRLNKHLNLRAWYFQVLLLLIAFSSSSFANTEYEAYIQPQFSFTPRSKIEAQIGSGELNRIEVNGGDIMEVIGDTGKYSLYWSSDWRNLFIKPKVAVGETLDLSLIFFGGLAQDIRFTAGDTTAKTITINVGGDHLPHIHKHDFRPVSDHHLQAEITSMMRAMFEDQPRAEGVKGKYYVTDIKRLLKTTPELQITQIKAYRYKNFSGAVLEIKNSSKASIQLLEEDFKGLFKSTLAINLKSTSIAARSKTLVFVVTHGGSNDK